MTDMVDVPARYVVRRVLADAVRNVVFFGVIALLVVGFSRKWPVVGTIGFWMVALVVALDALHVVATVLLPGLASVVLTVKGRGVKRRAAAWLWLGTLIRLAEVAVGIILALYIRRHLP